MLTFKTLNPRDPRSGKVEVTFPDALVERWQKEMPTRWWNLFTVAEVLEQPERIFSGIRTVNLGGWCYSGIPQKWYMRERVSATFPQNMVYLVFVNEGLVVYTFRAEHSDRKDKYSPEGWEDRYGSLVWKNSP